MIRRLIWALFFFTLLVTITGGVAGVWGYFYFTRDLPNLSSVRDYRPPAVTRVYARDETLIAEFYFERRYPARLAEVPKQVQRCFLAAEDASFYTHPGIDPMSILRAVVKNIESGSPQQGGSTITQQVVKNLLLTPEKRLTRKVKEAILSYRLEKALTKDEILEIYLNQIFFGNTAYGIKAAARLYFHKELEQVSLAEGAILAGLPKAPTKYSPLLSMARAKKRQRYVLQQMVKAGFATKDEVDVALKEDVQVYPASPQNIFHAPHYVTEVRKILLEQWKELDIDRDGLEIHTAVDLRADEIGLAALRKGLREVDKRRGWRGPLAHVDQLSDDPFRASFGRRLPEKRVEGGKVYPALVTSAGKGKETVQVQFGKFTGSVNLKTPAWARRFRTKEDKVTGVRPEDVVRRGDVIEVILPVKEKQPPAIEADPKLELTSVAGLELDQTPDVEGALVLIDPFSGEILSLIGGYDYAESQFNRVTQALRQPGSSFKPILYLAAVDGFRYTPSTIVHDTPRAFRVGDQFWEPANFDRHFLGPITLRTALEKSRNLVSADIISRIGVDAVISYAERLGIKSKLGRNLSLSLGSSEVTPLEMTRAYGVFPAGGLMFDSTFITKMIDREGATLFDSGTEVWKHGRRAVPESSAFVMTHLMKGVIESGTGYKVKALERPVGGKTGTSNDQMDAWFIGYTPHWVCGIWVGFDEKKEIGPKETGGVVSAPIFTNFMRDFLAYREPLHSTAQKADGPQVDPIYGIPLETEKDPPQLDFAPPSDVEPYFVQKASGLQSTAGEKGAILEYFVRGTEPPRAQQSRNESGEGGDDLSLPTDYLESPDL